MLMGLFHFGIMSMGLFSFFLTWKMEKISTKKFGITKKYIIFAIIFHVTNSDWRIKVVGLNESNRQPIIV